MFRRWLGPNERETVATQVTMEDGTESPLVDHMRDAHQKGTNGYTEEYLGDLHRNLHQRKREPGEELEHTHPGATSAQGSSAGAASRERDSEVPRTSETANDGHREQHERATPEVMNTKHRDREEQGMSGSMKAKNRDRQRNQEAGNGQHRDRYQPQASPVPDQRSREAEQVGNGEAMNGEHRDGEDDMVSAGSQHQGHQRNGNGKHRKHRH